MTLTMEELHAFVRERAEHLRLARPPLQRVESAADVGIILIYEVLGALLARELRERTT